MDFSDKKYLQGLDAIIKSTHLEEHTNGECFYQLIDGVPKDLLDNLIKLIVENKKQLGYEALDEYECYKLLQNKNIDDLYKEIFLDFAYQCLDSGLLLGNSINEFGFNKSSYLAHSLQEARLCSTIALKCGLDSERAFRMGLLHDYGRKYNQGSMHIILGFEKLYDLGYYEEAVGCLTHSFLNGNFFACYSPSKDYVVDDNLNAIAINEKIYATDLYSFLSNYKYSDYDRILNIADLMATEKEVVSPEIRILDIESRRKMEGKQREFFFAQLASSIIWCLKKMNNTRIIDDKVSFSFLSDMLLQEILIKNSAYKLHK